MRLETRVCPCEVTPVLVTWIRGRVAARANVDAPKCVKLKYVGALFASQRRFIIVSWQSTRALGDPM